MHSNVIRNVDPEVTSRESTLRESAERTSRAGGEACVSGAATHGSAVTCRSRAKRLYVIVVGEVARPAKASLGLHA